MIEWERLRLDARYYLPFGSHGIAERSPGRCPAGHPLIGDRVLVASHPCSCQTRPHRIWRCWECDGVWVWPPCPLHPDWSPWYR